jgi:hypothetical protein
MAGRWLLLVLCWASLTSLSGIADAQERPPDEISKLLFETYLDGPRKINTSTIMAASQIVADRGRTSGFWRQVLAELKSDDEHSEVNCVRILGNMLATDAAARDAIRRQKETGEVTAWIPSVELGPEVVRELIERGKQADRFRMDHYAIALARARVPEAKNFFASILSAETGPPTVVGAQKEPAPLSVRHLDGTRFHAAVGLAQLGDPVGIEWLMANCEDPNGFVQHARPYLADRGGSIGTCCQAALQRLSNRSDLTTNDEWEAWWKTADKAALANRAVEYVDP